MLLLLLAEEPLHQTPEFLANKSTSGRKNTLIGYQKFASNEKAYLGLHVSSGAIC